jgi:nucleoside diphosphate kinase
VTRLEDSIRKFNYQGDTQFLTGQVVAKREEAGMHLVDLEMKMRNQRDLETAYAKATVSLPSREAGLALLPDVPRDIAERTARMYARHNELLAEKRRGS